MSMCMCVPPPLFDEARYLLLDVGGEKVAGVPVHGTAAGVDQELLKVPRYIGPEMKRYSNSNWCGIFFDS